jgi:hypothetical protein
MSDKEVSYEVGKEAIEITLIRVGFETDYEKVRAALR